MLISIGIGSELAVRLVREELKVRVRPIRGTPGPLTCATLTCDLRSLPAERRARPFRKMRDRPAPLRGGSRLPDVAPCGCTLTSRRHRAPPLRPPFRIGSWFSPLSNPPPPGFSPPPCTLFTVAHARRSASSSGSPRSSYPSSMCSAWRFCLSVYRRLSPRGILILRLKRRKRNATDSEVRADGCGWIRTTDALRRVPQRDREGTAVKSFDAPARWPPRVRLDARPRIFGARAAGSLTNADPESG